MQQKNIGLERLYDRYNYRNRTKKDYMTLPDDPNFQQLLSSQQSLMQESSKRLSPQNQDKLVFAFRKIYQKMLDASPKRSLS